MANSAATIIEAIGWLEREGFQGQFRVRRDETIKCVTCGKLYPPNKILLLSMLRVESDSDSESNSLVCGMKCVCSALGTEVFGFGTEADPFEMDALQKMKDARTGKL